MFRNAIRLPFRILGIPIQLDITFLIFLPVLAWMIGSNLPQIANLLGLAIAESELSRGTLGPYVIGLIAAIGLFLSVLIHEIGHSVVARGYGIGVRSITLWLLGGMAQLEEMPRHHGVEAVIAIAGPITSFLLGVVFWLPLTVIPDAGAATVLILTYLSVMNWLLAAFNLLPALPLDGGRVLRSLLALRMNYVQATRSCGTMSRVIALILGLVGFLTFNLLLLLVSLFVFAAATAEAATVTTRESLRGLQVRDLMTRDVKSVQEHLLVSDLLRKMLEERYLGYPVMDLAGRLSGLVSLEDIKRRAPGMDQAETTQVKEIMRAPAPCVHDTESAAHAFQSMSEQEAERLAVVNEGGELVGVLSNTDLVRAVQILIVDSGSPGARTSGVRAEAPSVNHEIPRPRCSQILDG